MSLIRLFCRLSLLLLVVSGGMLISPLIHRGNMPRQGLASRITLGWHRTVARVIGIRIQVSGRPCDQAALYAANHISWFDITALGAQLPLRFLSKAEVRTWPLLGWLASRAGTLYIERGNHQASAAANARMREALLSGENVCLFPEGTTTDGHLRKFHSRLLQCAIDAGCPLQPVALYYPPADPDSGLLTHPAMLFTGDTPMLQSFMRILRAKNLRVQVHLLPPIDSRGKTRHQLTQLAQQAISAQLQQIRQPH